MRYRLRKINICPHCKKEFYANVHNQKYCSIKCRNNTHDKRRRQGTLSSQLCKCGCGNYTNSYRGKPRDYIFTHYHSHEHSLQAIKIAAEAHRLKIDWQSIALLYTEQKLNFTEIAKQLHCNVSTVARNLNKIGIKTREIKGFYINKLGYAQSTLTGHLIHREIMEEYIGKPLLTSEHVHHKNGIKIDNRLENLEIIIKGQHHKKWAELLKENLELKKEIDRLKYFKR